MKTQTMQDAGTAWLAKMADPNAWQDLLKQPNITQFSQFANGAMMPPPLSQDLAMLIEPDTLTKLQADYVKQFGELWQTMASAKPPEIRDKRFNGEAWQANSLYAFNAAAYLLNARFLMAMVDSVKATGKIRQKIRFAVQQAIDAMSPSNFLVTNPEAQKKLIETRGESLVHGIALMLADMQKGRISQSDETAFEVGVNVATTEGAVVFENELFQLIQYKPLTKTVYKRPLLMVPPCINKYYIMDLQPANSLVRYAVEQGHTVFLMSWVNPGPELGNAGWDDYIEKGPIRALEVARAITGQDQVNALGFCVGGTIISTALSVLKARGENPVASLTLLTTLLDYSDPGVLEVYIDEAQVARREASIGKDGLMPGRDFTAAFSSLRPNDLVWNYVEQGYLKGIKPPAFDLLYWNADATNLPGPMFCYYLRNMYLENNLREPGKLTVAGQKVDLGRIDVPAFIYGSREDHIVPWTAAYASVNLINPGKPENNRFVLGASGHIAGVINPASKNKRSYWVAPQGAGDAQAWKASAEERPGSWWVEWARFLAENGGGETSAPRKYGNAKYAPTEPAPGRYVKAKAA
ncbi:class I poly(R)-hydroxyalkanoic acid synthase [Noviherbaspirillum pedocola]|uniref:Class I poly(R)-hydroxyalkanoic acid synthase n=1 Tax=Noviherbaspirillum pedocola TaxID=2801341 RepID=A0A934W6H7_9BURK|nr:class I poly(R)-hydroxyalkanoic acid synthase [Noviherbaspirillum pedocola]MBK4736242.1 class I poly(R)-hydroxyalkanoic acid synthase [Noviherbaspirillum pedocola]